MKKVNGADRCIRATRRQQLDRGPHVSSISRSHWIRIKRFFPAEPDDGSFLMIVAETNDQRRTARVFRWGCCRVGPGVLRLSRRAGTAMARTPSECS